MAKYRIRDKNTGMEVVVRGDQPPPEEALSSIFAKTKETASQLLQTGDYKFDDQFNKIPKEQFREKTRKLAPQAMGVAPDEVDVDTGMGLWERTKLSFQPTEADKMKQLEDTYGKENVSMLDIGGKPKMFYRDPKTKKMTMVDEMGASLADFTADLAGEVAPIAGAVAGGIVGSLASPVLGTAAGAAAGYGAVSGVQDMATRVASDEEVRPGEIAKRRGIETGIGFAIDLPTAGLGKFVSRRIGKNMAAEFSKGLNQNYETLLKSEALNKIQFKKTQLPPALRGSELRSAKASELADLYPKSKVAQDFEALRSQIAIFQQQVSGEAAGFGEESFSQVAQKIASRYRTLIDDVADIDRAAAKEIEDSLSGKMRNMVSQERSFEETGRQIRELIAPGVKQIEEANEANWTNLRQIGGGVNVPIKSITNAIQRARSQFQRLDDPSSAKIAKDLEQMLKGKAGEPTGLVDQFGRDILGAGVEGKTAVDFNEFREIIDSINDAVSRNKEAGFSTRERVAQRVLDNLSGEQGLRSQIAAQNPQLGQALAQTLDFYKNNLLATKRSAVGRTLREQLADPAITETQVTNLAIQDPAYARQAIQIAEASGGQEAAMLRQNLQQAYLNKIGLVEDFDIQTFNFDADIARELFDKSKVDSLRNLQQALKQAQKNNPKLATGNVKPEEINELFSAYGTQPRQKIINKILERNKKLAKARDLENKRLIKMLLPTKDKTTGAWEEPKMSGTSFATFADNFIATTPDDVRKAMGALRAQGDEEGLKAFQQEFVAQLFRRYSKGAQRVGKKNLDLWNPQALDDALKGKLGPNIKKNMKEVLGETRTKEILSANDLLKEASTFGARETAGIQPRFSATGQGIQFYIVGDVLRNSRNRLLSWAYGSDKLVPLMNLLTRDVGDEQAEKGFLKVLVPMLTSQKGLLALAREAQQDPEFALQAERLMSELSQGDETISTAPNE